MDAPDMGADGATRWRQRIAPVTRPPWVGLGAGATRTLRCAHGVDSIGALGSTPVALGTRSAATCLHLVFTALRPLLGCVPATWMVAARGAGTRPWDAADGR